MLDGHPLAARPRVAAVHAEIAEGDRWAAPLPSIEALKVEARAAGLWNLFMPPAPEGKPAAEPLFHEVKKGETLSEIAQQHLGKASRYREIFEANRPMLSDPDKIYPGQKLRIPQD